MELTGLVDGALPGTEVACVDEGVTITGVVRVVFVALDGVSMYKKQNIDQATNFLDPAYASGTVNRSLGPGKIDMSTFNISLVSGPHLAPII